MMTQLWTFASAHKPTLIIAFGWFIREIPVVWKSLQDNGGLLGVWKSILNGRTEIKTTVAVTADTAQPKEKTP